MSQPDKLCSGKSNFIVNGISRIFRQSLQGLSSQKKVSLATKDTGNVARTSNVSPESKTEVRSASKGLETGSGLKHHTDVNTCTDRNNNTWEHRQCKPKLTCASGKSGTAKLLGKTGRQSRFEENTGKGHTKNKKLGEKHGKGVDKLVCLRGFNVSSEDWSFELKAEQNGDILDRNSEQANAGTNQEKSVTAQQFLDNSDEQNNNVYTFEDWSYELKADKNRNFSNCETVNSKKVSSKEVISSLEDLGSSSQTGTKNVDVGNRANGNAAEDWSLELELENKKGCDDNNCVQEVVNEFDSRVNSQFQDQLQGLDDLSGNIDIDFNNNEAEIQTDQVGEVSLSDTRCSDEVSSFRTAYEDLNEDQQLKSENKNIQKEGRDSFEGVVENVIEIENFERDIGKTIEKRPFQSTPKKKRVLNDTSATDSKYKHRIYRESKVEGKHCGRFECSSLVTEEVSVNVEKDFDSKTSSSQKMENKNFEDRHQKPLKRRNDEKEIPPRFSARDRNSDRNRSFNHNMNHENFRSHSQKVNSRLQRDSHVSRSRHSHGCGKEENKQFPRDHKSMVLNKSSGSAVFGMDRTNLKQNESEKESDSIPSLLELNMKTPENMKFKTSESHVKKKNSWKFPVLEDWTDEIEEISSEHGTTRIENVTVQLDGVGKEVESTVSETEVKNELSEITVSEIGARENTEKDAVDSCVNHVNTEPGDGSEVVSAEAAKLKLSLPPQLQEISSSEVEVVHFKSEDCKKLECKTKERPESRPFNKVETEKLVAISEPYLPPIPDEVIESGDEVSWKDEHLKKSRAVVCNFKKGTVENKNADVDIDVERHQNKPVSKINNTDEKTLLEGNLSSGELKDKIDGKLGQAFENNTNKVEVSELPSDKLKPAENTKNISIDKSFNSVKSVPSGQDTFCDIGNSQENSVVHDRQGHEEYADYFYDKSQNSVPDRQYGPWYPNYPYSYEAYQRWCQYVQYQQYWWQIYQQQQQYHEQYSMYCNPYYHPQKPMEERRNERLCKSDEVDGTRQKELFENYDDQILTVTRDGSVEIAARLELGIEGQDIDRHVNDLKTEIRESEQMIGSGLTEYWPERMNQWVKNQCPELNEKISTKEGSYREKYASSNASFEAVEKGSSVDVEKQRKDTPSDVFESISKDVVCRDDNSLKSCSDCIVNSSQYSRSLQKSETLAESGITEREPLDMKSDGTKPQSSQCSCRVEDIQFLIWRMCRCQVGNLKLEQVLPCNPEDRSIDFGYLSNESLDQNGSSLKRTSDTKGPGFVIQPLCSTPDESSQTVKQAKKVAAADQIEKESTTQRAKHPPPGFYNHTGCGELPVKDVISSRHTDIHKDCLDIMTHKKSLQSRVENLRINCHSGDPSTTSSVTYKEKDWSLCKHSLGDSLYRNKKAELCNSLERLRRSAATIKAAMAKVDAEDVQNALELALRAVNREIGEVLTAVNAKEVEGVMKVRDGNVRHAEADKNLDDNMNEVKVMKKRSSDENPDTAKYYGNLDELDENWTDQCNPQGYEWMEKKNEKEVKKFDMNLMSVSGGIKKSGTRVTRKGTNSKTAVSTASIEGYSETSGDEFMRRYYESQSDSVQSDWKEDEYNAYKAKMKDPVLKKAAGSTMASNFGDKNTREIEEEEILENEIMSSWGTASVEQSRKYPMGGIEIVSRPPFRARSPMSHFAQYRGKVPFSGPTLHGFREPPPMPPGYREHWQQDPGYPLPPPPPPPRWLPPSMMTPPPPQTFMPGQSAMPMKRPLVSDPRFMYIRSMSWEGPASYLDHSRSERRFSHEEMSYDAPPHQAVEMDVQTKHVQRQDIREEVSTVLETKHPRRTSLNLTDYSESDCDDDSDGEIVPFAVEELQNVKKLVSESRQKSAAQLRKHAPKKLKTDTEDDSSSVDSLTVKHKENNEKLLESTKATKLNRGPHKKLKQKSLSSFTAAEWTGSRHEPQQKEVKQKIDLTPTKTLQEPMKRKTLAEIVAETKSGKCSKVNKSTDEINTEEQLARDFPPLGTDPQQLAPLPPLPPFPNSPFWAMYRGSNIGTTPTKTPDGQFTLASSIALHKSRRSLENSRWNRFSPGQSGGRYIFSPSETDSETNSVRNDWKTNFKLFHNFGVKYIDTHCHLDFLFSREGFRGSFRGYMDKHKETFPEQFEGCVAVFCNPASFTPHGGLWKDVAKEPNVWIAMGCHPKMATEFTSAAEAGLKKCLGDEKCIALGEIGLDYSGTFYQHEVVQKDVFRRQLKIAIDMGKPLVIHCRDAEDDCLEIMKEMVPQKWKIHCHCFTNAYSNAQLWLDAFPNLYIGVTPLVTYRTAKPTHDLARKIPIQRLLLETDAPYFIPSCIPRDDLPLSNPGLAVTVAKEIAQYQELPVAAVLRQCRLNTKFMYGI